MTTTSASSTKAARVAFVAGGGGVKGYAFHLGVLRGMEQEGFQFRTGLKWQPNPTREGAREIDTFVGSSGGGCVVAALTSGHSVEELRKALFGTARDVPRFGYQTLFVPVAPHPAKYLRRLVRRSQLGGLRPRHLADLSGFLTTRGVERYFRKHVLATNRFSDLAPELFLIATQVNTSRKVVFGPMDSFDPARRYDPSCAYYDNVQISEALAGSVSVPPVFAPYAIVNPSNGKRFHYYDGEVRDALSAHVARDAGADYIISSSIWRPYQYDEQVGTLADLGMSALTEQAIHQTFEQKIDQDRQRSARYQKLLEMIDARETTRGVPRSEIERFKSEVSDVLDHRPSRTLHIAPAPGDHEFFFSAAFRFDPTIIDRCVEAGVRAYRWSVDQDASFLPALDQRMKASVSSG